MTYLGAILEFIPTLPAPQALPEPLAPEEVLRLLLKNRRRANTA